MSKREKKAFIEGIKVTLGSIAFIGLSIAFILYTVWVY